MPYKDPEARKAASQAHYDKNKSDPEFRAARNKKSQKWSTDNPEHDLLCKARWRARKRGTKFEINIEDIMIPETCPVLGIVLKRGTGTGRPLPESPSIDELVHGEGYTPDNSMVISYKANCMKNNASPAELLMFADWIYKTFGGSDASKII